MSSMTDVQVLLMFVFGLKMTNQQLQKWELKFVTELEPWKGPPQSVFLVRRLDSCGRMVACSATLKG